MDLPRHRIVRAAGSGKPRRILAVRGGALGDFILTLPALQILRGIGDDLQLLTRPAYGRLAGDFGLVSGWRALDAPAAALLAVAGAGVDPDWQDWLSGFDAVVSWVPDPDGVFQQQIRHCGAGEFYQGDGHARGPEPAAVQIAKVIPWTRTGWAGPARPLLPAPPQLKPVPYRFAFHPGSGSPRKNWSLGCWITVMQHLQSAVPPIRWLVITGEAEAGRLPAITAALEKSGLAWEPAHDLDLTTLASRLQECGAFFGHDSGISHLAAACGVPCRLLFGPTSPAVWAPGGNQVRVLAAPGGQLDTLTAGRVLEWIAENPPAG